MPEELKKEEAAKGEAGIRTMKTDVADYLKETKPSLLSILTQEMRPDGLAQEPGYKLKSKPRWLPLVAALAILLILGGGGYWTFRYFSEGETNGGGSIITPPKSIFAAEKTKTVLARSNTDLIRNLQALGEDNERDGIVTKLDMRILEAEGAILFIPETFFKAIGAKPPPEFYTNHTSALHPFLYSDNGATRFGALFLSKDGARSLQQMLAWEPTIQRDLEPFFLGQLPESAIGVFVDKSYRNINYRFLSLSRSEDLGVGYFLFNVKKYLVITTSEKAMEVIINRLFETN
ncbi:MAG: hypothetical protein Q7R73_03040 [bacterium]|nr:hypothetical protein [bacterium]